MKFNSSDLFLNIFKYFKNYNKLKINYKKILFKIMLLIHRIGQILIILNIFVIFKDIEKFLLRKLYEIIYRNHDAIIIIFL